MSSVIEVSFGIRWDYAVVVETAHAVDQIILGPRQALRYLQTEFTLQSGRPYRNAVSACKQAICNPKDLGRSREAFITAYTEYRAQLRH